jgi:hypothetical protein
MEITEVRNDISSKPRREMDDLLRLMNQTQSGEARDVVTEAEVTITFNLNRR